MSSVTSLRKKDNMWIYKNPQGLQLLNDELEQRRNKRFARGRSGTSQVLSPLLSPKQHHRTISKDPMDEVIPMAIVTTKELSTQKPTDIKSRSPAEINQADIKTVQQQENLKLIVIPQHEADIHRKQSTIKKELSLTLKEIGEQKAAGVKKHIVISSTLQEKKDALKQYAMQDKSKQVLSSPNRVPLPIKISSSTQVVSPTQITSSIKVAPPIRANSPIKIASPTTVNSHIKVTPITRVTSPTPPARVTSPIRVSTSTRVASPTRATSPPIRLSSPIQVSSPPTRTASTIVKPESNFLLEAKQKLFFNLQPKISTVRKSLPNAPKKSGLVSSFIPSIETPISSRSMADVPVKPPRHVIKTLAPTSSVSTPLSPPIIENIVPVSSSSSILPASDSYFSGVIDRRFNGTPTVDQAEEEPIQVYYPQLSPEISFCGNTLDVPSDDECHPQVRPCIKKRVSFSEQISTYISEDDISVSTEDEERGYSPVNTFLRTMSSELTDVSIHYGKDPHEKFLPNIQQRKEVSPQKLSNKLLDMFQKKPKVIEQPAVITTTRELTHLTKTRPRKPSSLKKPTTLTYPAAIAQPDWRTRALLTKKSSVFI